MISVVSDVPFPDFRSELVDEAAQQLMSKEHKNLRQAALSIWQRCWRINHPNSSATNEQRANLIHNLSREISLRIREYYPAL